jgi:hypothetical protein
LLQGLPGADINDVRFDVDHACLAGTRTQLLDDIIAWVNNPQSGPIFWLTGPAATGKSSVANSVAAIFAELGHLGASFRFNRDQDRLNTLKYLFSNIAYQLAYFDEHLRDEILLALRTNGSMSRFSLSDQFRILITETTNAVDFVGPVVIVVDAFDESGDVEARGRLPRVLGSATEHLPSHVKFLVTSRAEHDIESALAANSKIVRLSLDGLDGTSGDVLTFLQKRIVDIKVAQRKLPPHWPGREGEIQLLDQAGNLFIWAAVACAFMYNGDAAVRFSKLLRSVGQKSGTHSGFDKLDKLYLDIVLGAYEIEPPSSYDELRYVLGSLILAKDPLTVECLDELLGLGYSLVTRPLTLPDGALVELTTAESIINSIRSLLTQRGVDCPMRVLHPSVYEFFTTPGRCVDLRFHIDAEKHNEILAIRYLTTMNDRLRTDICNVGNSFASTSIHRHNDMADRVSQCVSAALRYASCFLAEHIQNPHAQGSHLVETLDHFISIHILHWIEVMSLLGEIPRAEKSLKLLLEISKV